ncbi:hypothetical protein [Paraburkholderia dilworthii]|uniref:hypothetical protein n=1 Tax=Paraburkholderia dilworthii TaxID=948106 RepID=UPI0004812E70|nr:hypothetical protein [Paraburkholderia dilworthii]
MTNNPEAFRYVLKLFADTFARRLHHVALAQRRFLTELYPLEHFDVEVASRASRRNLAAI